MAELHVQTKKNTPGSMWIWIVLALVIIGAVVYYLATRNKTADNTAPPANTTGAIHQPVKMLSIEGLMEPHNTAMYGC